MAEVKFPTEVVDLPSKGLLYPKDSPLSSGTIEIKYMTAREEDILTSANLIKKGVVVEKLLESLIIDKSIKVDDLLIGDKNSVLIASRILAYGKEYEVEIDGRKIEVDLTTLKDIPLDESMVTNGANEFEFELPATKRKLTFKLLTSGDEKEIDNKGRRSQCSDRNIYQKCSRSFIDNVLVETFSIIKQKFMDGKDNEVVDNDWILIKKKDKKD